MKMESGLPHPAFLIMGVVNVTPDSFSDGGKYSDVRAATTAALKLIDQGADLVDFGAESTRPGASEVPLQEELDRLMPVLESVLREVPGERVSIDSRKDVIFVSGAELGARWFNRVGSIPGPDTLSLIARTNGARLVMTHMHGVPATMQNAPLVRNEALHAVDEFFDQVASETGKAGLDRARIWFDPGIGFGKSLAANLAMIGEIRRWSGSRQILIGVSRKSFLGQLFGISHPVDRDGPGKVVEAMCAFAGAGIIRTHEVSGLAQIRQRIAGSN